MRENEDSMCDDEPIKTSYQKGFDYNNPLIWVVGPSHISRMESLISAQNEIKVINLLIKFQNFCFTICVSLCFNLQSVYCCVPKWGRRRINDGGQ